MHAGPLKVAPGAPGYDAELATAIEAYTEQLATATHELYERHRSTTPGWESRPLRIH